jgi:hypothetical protein
VITPHEGNKNKDGLWWECEIFGEVREARLFGGKWLGVGKGFDRFVMALEVLNVLRLVMNYAYAYNLKIGRE